MNTKDELRAWARQTARTITKQRKAESDFAAMEQLLSLKEFQKAETVFCYVSVRDEVSTLEILKEVMRLKKTVCVPRCLSECAMEAAQINDLSDLEAGMYGIPSAKKEAVIIPVSKIDFAVLPCLCADAEGYRIGYGKGYYDRFLAGFKGFSVVLCRKELLVKQIPRLNHDQKADFVIAT